MAVWVVGRGPDSHMSCTRCRAARNLSTEDERKLSQGIAEVHSTDKGTVPCSLPQSQEAPVYLHTREASET